MVSDSIRSFRAYVKCEANQADTLLVEAGYAHILGPAAELVEVSVEVGEPHPLKQQGKPQLKTALGLIPSVSGRPGFSPWVRKIPWKRTWQPTLVFLPGESPWTEEPGRLQSVGLQTVGHN